MSFSGSISWDLQYNKITGKNQGIPEWTNTFTFTPSISFYKLPIDFLFILSSLESRIRQPFNRFSIHIKKPWLDLYLGDAHPSYSTYTLNGILVRGGSVDLSTNVFRFGITYGETRRAVEASDSSNASYKQILFGGRIGIGSRKGSYIDLIFIKAKDDTNSIKTPTTELRYNGDTLIDTVGTLLPQENAVVGLKGQLSLAGGIVKIGSEISGSAFTRDIRIIAIDIPGYPKFANSIIRPRLSTSVDLAGKIEVGITFSSTSLSGTYKYIGPGYYTLGNPNLINDIKGFSFSISQRLWDNQILLNAGFDRTRDNLLGLKNATTTTETPNFNVVVALEGLPSISLNYNSYTLTNDASIDSLKVDNMSRSFSMNINAGFKFLGLEHSSNISYSMQKYRDRAPLVQSSPNYDMDTWMFSFNTDFNIPLSLSWGVEFSQDKQYVWGNNKKIFSGNIDLSFRMFEDKLSNSLGVTFDETKGNDIKNQKWGISLRSNCELPVLGNISVTVEKTGYSDLVNPSEKYQEFTVRLHISRSFR